jgi:Ammonium Transporter Family
MSLLYPDHDLLDLCAFFLALSLFDAGLVAISGGCSVVEMEGAITIGAVAAILCKFSSPKGLCPPPGS